MARSDPHTDLRQQRVVQGLKGLDRGGCPGVRPQAAIGPIVHQLHYVILLGQGHATQTAKQGSPQTQYSTGVLGYPMAMNALIQRGFSRPEMGTDPITRPARPSSTSPTAGALLGGGLARPALEGRLQAASDARGPFCLLRLLLCGGLRLRHPVWFQLFPFATRARSMNTGGCTTVALKGPGAICAMVVEGEELPSLNPTFHHKT
eukprot:826856-Rhodomonas_salina.3